MGVAGETRVGMPSASGSPYTASELKIVPMMSIAPGPEMASVE